MDNQDVQNLVETILGEIEKQVGGVAKAQGETLAGSFGQAKAAMSDFASAIGEILSPALEGASGMVESLFSNAALGLDLIFNRNDIKVQLELLQNQIEIGEKIAKWWDGRNMATQATEARLKVAELAIEYGNLLRELKGDGSGSGGGLTEAQKAWNEQLKDLKEIMVILKKRKRI